MKKFFSLAAIAVLALASCSNNTLDTSRQKEISYNAVTAKNGVTRAINDKSYYAPSDPSFGIWGLYQENGAFATDKGDGVWVGNSASSATEITYNNSAWRNAANTDYWPLTGSLVFMGYSPYADDAHHTIAAEVSVVSATPAVKITFDDFSSEAGLFTTDLMWSDAVEKSANDTNYDGDGNNTTTYNGVPVVFHHALSQIVVRAKTDIDYAAKDYTFTITDISITADDVADLEVTDSPAGSPTVSWSEPATDATATLLASGTTPLTTSFAAQGDSIVVIPQTLTAGQDIMTITYEVEHNSLTTSKTVTINLTGGTDATLSSLAHNTKYNLNLIFSLTEIKYSPDVTPWTPANSTYNVPAN